MIGTGVKGRRISICASAATSQLPANASRHAPRDPRPHARGRRGERERRRAHRSGETAAYTPVPCFSSTPDRTPSASAASSALRTSGISNGSRYPRRSARSWIFVQCSGLPLLPEHRDRRLERLHQSSRRGREHAFGEQVEHRGIGQREPDRRGTHDELAHAERGEPLEPFEHSVGGADQPVPPQLLERHRVDDARRQPFPHQLVSTNEVRLVLADDREQAERQPERRGIAALALAGFARGGRPLRVRLGRPPPDRVPAVGEPRREPQQPRTALAAHEQRRPRLLHRPRMVVRLAQREPLPLERRRLVAEQRSEVPHGLLEQREPLPDRSEPVAERLELVGEPSGPEPELDAAVREAVDRRDGLRDDRGVAERRRQHERSQPHPFGQRRERRERRQRFERPVPLVPAAVATERREQVIGHPHAVEPEPLGPDRDLRERLEPDRRHPRDREVVVR